MCIHSLLKILLVENTEPCPSSPFSFNISHQNNATCAGALKEHLLKIIAVFFQRCGCFRLWSKALHQYVHTYTHTLAQVLDMVAKMSLSCWLLRWPLCHQKLRPTEGDPATPCGSFSSHAESEKFLWLISLVPQFLLGTGLGRAKCGSGLWTRTCWMWGWAPDYNMLNVGLGFGLEHGECGAGFWTRTCWM